MPFNDRLRFNDEKSVTPILPAFCQSAPKQSILKTKGRPFSGSVQNGQLLTKGEDFRDQFKARRKKRSEQGKREEGREP
jgi:hypothetical protein